MEPRSSRAALSPLPVLDGGEEPPDLAMPDIIIADRRWKAAIPFIERRIMRALDETAEWLGVSRTPTVLLESNRTVKRLNHDFRGRNKPTNVLTFDAPDGFGDGDIILAFETVRDEARAAGRPIAAHLSHLIVHGVLHLAGFDHHRPGEASAMEAAETRILHRLGVPNPWCKGRVAP